MSEASRACNPLYSMLPTDVDGFAALAATRAGNLFTTHTAVVAGFDRYTPAMVEYCLGVHAENQLGISLHDLLALGRQNPRDETENFNFTYLVVRGSSAVNGVSQQLFAAILRTGR